MSEKPQRTAKEKASASFKNYLFDVNSSDSTDSSSDGDTFKLPEKKLDKGKERKIDEPPVHLDKGKGRKTDESLAQSDRKRGHKGDIRPSPRSSSPSSPSSDNQDSEDDDEEVQRRREKRKLKSIAKQERKELRRKKREEKRQRKRRRREGGSESIGDGDHGSESQDNSDVNRDSEEEEEEEEEEEDVDVMANMVPIPGLNRKVYKGKKRSRYSQVPLMSVALSLFTQEQKAARALALMVLDGKRDDETYRWPVRENMLPSVPESSFMDISPDKDFFLQQGLGFVEELTGVPKTEADYSAEESSSEDENEDMEVNSADEGREEQELHQRRLSKIKRKLQEERHSDERAANSRLEQVHKFFKEEIVGFAQKQYRKGSAHRIKDLYTFQKKTLPPFRNRAARSAMSSSKVGDEELDELKPIQENGVAFAAEDSLRRVLDRLPYVIRQGALGEAPDYVKLGLPKPVSSAADYERGWDTIMSAACIAGVDDR
ncbi:hypothetical protein BGZ76_003066 [Entomortierella beljakovae]|nr:hypothetical protein BGZ76_003066 [Entomortierella beljakovae]